MYAIAKTTHPPTEVEHSVYCHFYNSTERSLLTAGVNQLKVYRLVRDPTVHPSTDKFPGETFEFEAGGLVPDNVKLECLQSFSLNGNIQSLSSVSFAGASRDCLVLTFNDAKVSIVEYDPNTHDLKTISMHYFEEDEMKAGFLQYSKVPLIRVDPENRCAALLIYNRNIVIIPFRKDAVTEDGDISLFLPSVSLAAAASKRSPVLPSYKLELPAEQYGANIINILDIQFLFNYYEPTLLILYEPIRTWAGRIAVRQDTVQMMTLSLDIHQHVHPHIWSTTNLPHNTFGALPVPKPIGGVLILASNSLIHLNQGLPPYGVSLNAFNDGHTSFPLNSTDGPVLSLDGSQAAFLTPCKILLSLNNGELYLLHLHNDTTRSLRSFTFIHLASSVIATTLTKCEDGFLFLGSRLSHSLLLSYFEKDTASVEASSREKSHQTVGHQLASLIATPSFDEGELSEDEWLYGVEFVRMQKRLKLDQEERQRELMEARERAAAAAAMETETEAEHEINQQAESETSKENGVNTVALEEERMEEETTAPTAPVGETPEEPAVVAEEEPPAGPTDHLLRVYDSPDGSSTSPCLLALCDSITNIGPCGMAVLGEPSHTCDNWANRQEVDVELITTAGYQKSGALNILQRSIKPQIETSFNLPGCLDTWTVYGPNYEADEEGLQQHEFLILNQEESTLVFQVGAEINELEQSGFITQSSTVFTGNLGANKYILQVCAHSVRLIDGIHELQHFPLDLGSPITHTSLADPYALLMTRDGQVLLLRLKIDAQKGSARLVVSKPDLSTARSKITTLCVYKDVSGLFTTEAKLMESVKKKKKTERTVVPEKRRSIGKKPSSIASTLSNLASASTVDEEDELLYGDSTVAFLDSVKTAPDNNSAIESNVKEEEDEEDEVPDDKVPTVAGKEPTFWLFCVRASGVLEIYTLPGFKLVYLVKNFPLGPRVLVDSIQTTEHSYTSHVDPSAMPLTLEILVTGMGLHQTRPVIFARFEEDLYVYEAFAFYEFQVDNRLKIRFKRQTTSTAVLLKYPRLGLSKEEYEASFEGKGIPATANWLRAFANIGGYSGVFLCGPFPCWFIMTGRGELRSHGMEVDGAVTSFSTFNNVNCPKGFLYFNVDEELRFSLLPPAFNLDVPWPLRQVPIRETVLFLSYHLESKTYAIVKSCPYEVDRVVRIGGDEKDYDMIDAPLRYIPAQGEHFQLQLLSPLNWEAIPGTLTEMDEWEHITCLKNVMLSSEGTSSGLKGYIAMGSNYNYGEDVTNRGRIWIADIIEVVPEPGKPLTKNKVKIVYCKEQKGPVTALCQVKGYLLSAIGQKIYIWQLKEADLVGIAFIDTQIYVHTAVSLRNLILIGDINKSISLLRYQEETRTLSLVSRDQKCLQILACEYMIDNTAMAFLVSDLDKNLLIYTYTPDAAESLGGTRLLRRADYHLGSHVNAFFRIRAKLPARELDSRLKGAYARKHLTMYVSLDGSVGYLLPISEKSYRRLLMLQNLLTTNVQHIAGLNPKAFRMVKLHRHELVNPSKNVLDGDLLFKYCNLPLNEKLELAKKIGLPAKTIINDLQEILCITSHF